MKITDPIAARSRPAEDPPAASRLEHHYDIAVWTAAAQTGNLES